MAAAPRPNPRRSERFRQQAILWPLYRTTEQKKQLDTILREHDAGNFFRSSGLLDELMTDDRIAGVLDTRAGALLAAPMQFRASSKKRKAAKLAELVGGTEDDLGLWPRIAPPDVLAEMIISGLMLNLAVAEIVWTVQARQQVPRLVPIHLQTCRYDHTLRRIVVTSMEGREVVLPDISEQPRGDAKWFVWAPRGLHNGWRRSMIRSLGDLYLKRRWNYRDWARYGEKHGMPVIEAKVPSGAEDDEIDEFVRDVGNAGSEMVVLAPQSKDGQSGFGISFIEPTAQTWQTFLNFKQQVDTDIAVRVLGQNLTTDNTAGGGSRALGDVQNLVRMDKLAEDSKIAQALRDQVLTWWAEFNFTDPTLAPVPEYLVQPPEDEKAEADTLISIGTAIRTLRDAGVPVDAIALAEKAGIPMLDEREPDEEPEPPPPAKDEAKDDAKPEEAEAGDGDDAQDEDET